MVPSVAAFAVSDDSAKVHRLEVDVIPGVILHTNQFLEGNNTEVRTMNHSFVARMKYAFQPPEGSQEALIYQGVYQGVGLAYHHFNPQLGNPVSAYIFQGATIKNLSNRLSLNYEWDFGLTYGWKAYDKNSYPENRVIGSKMTAYIDADVYLRWVVSQGWDLNLGASFTHYSNGNTSLPNAGLNVVGARLSAAYYLNRRQLQPPQGIIPPSEKGWLWDLTLWGAWKQKGVELEDGTSIDVNTYGVAGFHLNPLYRLNRWLNVGASLDGSYDGSADARKAALGLSARVEFVMPYFTINFGVGHHVLPVKVEDLNGFYEILALKIALMKQTYLHIGYSLYDFHYPNNLLLGLGFHL